MPTAASFSLLGRLPFAPIQIVVARSQAERARFILAAAGVEVLESDWETLAEQAVDGWICPLCDTEAGPGEGAPGAAGPGPMRCARRSFSRRINVRGDVT